MSEKLFADDTYYSFRTILETFLNFDYEFTRKNPEYPFNRKPEQIRFFWGQIIIPKYGIREVVQNKVSDIPSSSNPINRINMLYQIPFKEYDRDNGVGVINRNISLSFRYDKTYKYGDITKSIEEVCFWILEHAVKTNDYYIITDDDVFTFLSYFVIENQYGLGATVITSNPGEEFKIIQNVEEEENGEER